jgi:hypothetical protein
MMAVLADFLEASPVIRGVSSRFALSIVQVSDRD